MIQRWQISVWRDAPHYVSSRKWKLKRDTATHLLEWTKSRTLTTLNSGNDMEQQEFSFTVGGIQNDTAILEDSLSVSCKTKHTFLQGAIMFLDLLKELKTYITQKSTKKKYALFIIANTWKQSKYILQ